jgi:hypothetical protein
MPIGNKAPTKILDDELCFKKWYELGSLVKVQRWFQNEGKINPKTGKPFTPMAYWIAAMRWVVNYPDEAREYYKKLTDLDFDPHDDDEWWEYVIDQAKSARFLSKSRFEAWVIEHELQDRVDVPEPVAESTA